jgi:hypothetical protein
VREGRREKTEERRGKREEGRGKREETADFFPGVAQPSSAVGLGIVRTSKPKLFENSGNVQKVRGKTSVNRIRGVFYGIL